MPILNVSMREGKPPEYRRAIGDALYRAMREALGVPEGDRFIRITEHSAGNFFYGDWPDMARSDDLLYIQIVVFDTRTTEQKKALFRRIAELLGENPGIRGEDVFINLLESRKENWSLGKGLAQFGD